MQASFRTPVVLEGRHVRLVPLQESHATALAEVGLDPQIWRWSTHPIESARDMGDYVATALAERELGVSLPFVQVEVEGGRVIGSTRYGNIDPSNRRVEIGWTWIAPPWQRTAVNTEAKFLLLRHAFESLGCIRVELKTDALNARSRAAIVRIGAIEEGTLRQHMTTATDRLRDSVYFSVLDREWPDVKARLERMLGPR